MSVLYPKSKVELKGCMARYYDTVLRIVTLGVYSSIMREAIRLMGIKNEDRIIDLGAGSGENACLMMHYLSAEGELVGLDISSEMIDQFERKCVGAPNARIVNQRIDMPLTYDNEFDKAFISFVLHGFPQEIRIRIIRSVFKSLKDRGEFFILDYNEFSMKEMPLYLKVPFKLVECPYAFDFIARDWRRILAGEGFDHFEVRSFYHGYVRLLKAVKS